MRLPPTPLLLAAAALLAACARPDDAGPRYPEDTVLVMSGVPITAPEVDRVARRLEELSPTFTLRHRRRLALTNCLFPLVAARQGNREAREEARAAAEEFHARLAGGAQGPLPEPETGIFKSLGIEVWMQLTELEPGEWSDVFEVPGAFVVARLRERDGAERALGEQFVADVMRFPYSTSRAEIDAAVFDETLEILDPEWEPVIPAQWRLAMTGDRASR